MMTNWQSENGYYPLRKGKIATLVFYFEIFSPFPKTSIAMTAGNDLFRLNQQEIDRYRNIFRKIGSPWLWISRLKSSDEELRALLSHPEIEIYTISDGIVDVAFLELDFKQFGSMEIRYFGVLNEYRSKGIGKTLINFSFQRAIARDISHIWLHTCHFDDPKAPAFYEHFGFRATKTAVEIMDDPRLTGDLPTQMASHIPLLRNVDIDNNI